MTKILTNVPAHPVRSLIPALGVMENLGFDRETCLAGTGISSSQLSSDINISLQQELVFYGNTLKLSGDPMIGLKLGEPFIPQRYGLFGYTMLSAATFRHALTLAQKFSPLTFTLFTLRFGVEGRYAWFSMSDPPPIDKHLLDLYLDRDMSAGIVDFEEFLGEKFPVEEVHLTHDGHNRQHLYEEYFGCKVHFCASVGKYVFSSDILDKELPHSDPNTSKHLEGQCQMLIAKLSSHGHFIDDVRMLLLSRPGYFPDIDYVAEKLDISIRTLRRRLKDENCSYRQLLDEVRFGLAKEYLSHTKLTMNEIAPLLAYTEPATFSHAFKRWSGESPLTWRKQKVRKHFV